jgi:fatty acid desaturase
MTHTVDATPAREPEAPLEDHETLGLPGRHALEIGIVRELSKRSDAKGLLRIGGHYLAMALTATLIYLAGDVWWLLIPAMIAHGFTIVAMFAPMHECVHKTAFKTPWLNELVGWPAGALALYNFTYYRRYHSWHHRYTQDLDRDPELSGPKPQTFAQYAFHLSGIPFWINKPRELLMLSLGRTDQFPYVPASAKSAVVWSARAQLGLYLAIAVVSVATGSTLALRYWLLPAMLAEPLLRALLIVEHTGCSLDSNGLTNTRSTLAVLPVRFLMWNMPFHAEHHLYPSIPFHRLPDAHQRLLGKIRHISPSYPAANAEVVRTLGTSSPSETVA